MMNGYEKMTHFFCSSCYKSKEKSAFMISLNPSHHKYFPCCRTCLNTKFKKYKATTESDGAALYCLCAEMGYPMIQEIWNMAEKIIYDRTKDGKSPDVFICYHNTLKEIGYQVKGFWQSDMDFSDFMGTKKDKIKEEKPVELNLAQEEKVWGKFAAEEYELLNEFFEMYTQDLLNMDTAMELRYRDLCKAELRKRKADESGDMGEITKAEESLRKNMALLKLDKFQENKQSEIDKHIERMCWMVENTKPCECRDLDKYKDFSGFGIKWEEIMRCVKNLVSGSREYPDIPTGEV